MAPQSTLKLRPLDVRPIQQAGRPALLLRDPIRLSDKTVVLPRELGPALALCDGTRDVTGLHAALLVRYGLRLDDGVVRRLAQVLDDALLLDNERSAEACERTLTQYRQAAFRPPVSAGLSYPADPDELRQLLDGYLEAISDGGRDQVEDPVPPAHAVSPPTGKGAWPGRAFGARDVRGLISPHIDYQRGARVYAAVWARTAHIIQAAELAVILGTDHYGSDGSLTLTRQSYATPYGVLPTAQVEVDLLAGAIGEQAAFCEELHHRSEHSIELAAVWLHHMRGGQACRLVPILCGSFRQFIESNVEPEQDERFEAFVAALRGVIQGRHAVLIAAGDLAHIGPAFGGLPVDMLGRAHLQAADERLMSDVIAGDAAKFLQGIRLVGDRYNVCGVPPIYLALRLLQPTTGQTIAYERCPADERGTSLVSVCGIVLQ